MNMYTVDIFIDLSEAFDTKDHDISLLLTKFYNCGLRNISQEWFSHF